MTSIKTTLFRRSFVVFILILLFTTVILSITTYLLVTHRKDNDQDSKSNRLNILLIIVDDLRPALGCYGDKKAITPNIDQLATRSVLFNNAYTQQALSAPSRISFLMGKRPDSLHVFDNSGHYWRDNNQTFVTLPQHFNNHGYDTVSIGKVFHHGLTSNYTDDYPYSWSTLPYHPPALENEEVCQTPEGERMNLLCPVTDKRELTDMQVADYAVSYLHNRSKDVNATNPFFIAVGFYKPHIPFKFPSKYLDLHPLEMMDIASSHTRLKNMPDVAWNPWMDLRLKDDVKNLNIDFPFGSIPEHFQKRIRQGYYASASYIDDQVGKVLKALEESGYAPKTAIFFLSDHGWSLGEHGEWSKYSNFEVALKVPLLAYVPELTELVKDRKAFQHISVTEINPKNYKSATAKYIANEFVELVDLFPTLAEIANIAIPPICPSIPQLPSFCSEGISFYPVILDYTYPSMDFSWKPAVFSQCPRPSSTPRNNSDKPIAKKIKIMGYTIRNEHFRYTRWVRYDSWWMKPHMGTFEGHELYHKHSDPSENNNLVDNPDFSNVVISLFKKLRKGWQKSFPYAVYP